MYQHSKYLYFVATVIYNEPPKLIGTFNIMCLVFEKVLSKCL